MPTLHKRCTQTRGKDMSERHTPGPWRPGRMDMVSYDMAGEELWKNIYVDDLGGKVHMGERLPAIVARAYDALGCDCRDNARLIAAAPDMRAVLLEVEWAGDYQGDANVRCVCCGGFRDDGHEPDCKLAAALAKGGPT